MTPVRTTIERRVTVELSPEDVIAICMDHVRRHGNAPAGAALRCANPASAPAITFLAEDVEETDSSAGAPAASLVMRSAPSRASTG